MLTASRTTRTREEHLKWSIDHALDYLDAGLVDEAWLSMVHDLSKHVETRHHPRIRAGYKLFNSGQLATTDLMRDYLLGFQ